MAQKIILGIMGEMERDLLAILLQFLKARQLGITLLFQMLVASRVLFYRDVNAVVASADPDKSKAMAKKLEYIFDGLPWWLKPKRTGYRAGELIEYGDINSGLSIQWGNQTNGIARGLTVNVGHLSEIAEFERPEELIESSLLRTMHENPFSLLALEGTAEVMGDWWNDTWDYNFKMDSQGLARLKPIFLPWFVGGDIYPTEAWLRRRPVPQQWVPPQFISEHALAAKRYVERTPYLLNAFGDKWEMPLEQKWFYYLEYQEAEHRRRLPYLLRELPANPEEAWQSANPTVFDLGTLQYCRRRAQIIRPVGVYGIRGLAIPTYMIPGGDSEFEVKWEIDGYKEIFEFIPFTDPREWDDPDGKFYLWEHPLNGEEYGIGVDPSEGVGEDNSVIQVIKKATPDHPAIQVGEWASNRVNQDDLWAFLLAIGGLFYKAGRQPKTVIEVNISAGDGTQTELLKRGWSNFHIREDMTLVRPPKGFNSPPDRRSIGWKTTSLTRPRVVGLGRNHIRDRKLLVHSQFLGRELSTLVWNKDKQRIEAAVGQHDDRFMALAILLGSWYDPGLYGERVEVWEKERQREHFKEDHPHWGSQLGKFGTPKQGRVTSQGNKKRDSRGFYG